MLKQASSFCMPGCGVFLRVRSMSLIKISLLFSCFPVLLQAMYVDLGPGLCERKTSNGRTSVVMSSLYKGKGRECQQLCDETSACHGYSTSKFGGGQTDHLEDCSWSTRNNTSAPGFSTPSFVFSTLHEAQSACTHYGAATCKAVTCSSPGAFCTVRTSSRLQASTENQITYVPHPSCFDHDCILWEDEELSGGGQFMGGASCLVKDTRHGIHSQCLCHGEHCPWQPAPDCVAHFAYQPLSDDGSYEEQQLDYNDVWMLNVTGCTTADYNERGWCSTTTTLGSWDLENWRPCTKICPIGCYWQDPAKCVPIPKYEKCWDASQECVPEFWYRGNNYAGCTSVDSSDGIAWCSHRYRFTTAHMWSPCTNYCETERSQYAINTGSVVVIAICVFVLACFCRRSNTYHPVKTSQVAQDDLTEE